MANYRTVIEISSRWLKIMRSQKTARGMVITCCEVFNIDGVSDDERVVLLKNFCLSHRVFQAGDSIFLVLPRRDVILRVLNLPSQEDDELRRMVELQASQNTPYTREELVVDYILLERDVSGYSRVLAIMVPADVLERYRDICVRAGCRRFQVTFSSVGLSLWLKVLKEKDSLGEMAVVIDADEEAVEVCLISEYGIVFSRQVLIDDALEKSFRMLELERQYELTMGAYEKEGGNLNVKHIISAVPSLDLKTVVSARHSQGVVIHPGILAGSDFCRNNFVWTQKVLSGCVSAAAVCGIALYLGQVPGALVPASSREEENRGITRRALLRAVFFWSVGVAAMVGALVLPFFQKNTEIRYREKELRGLQLSLIRVRKKAEEVQGLEAVVARRVRVPVIMQEFFRLVNKDVVLVFLDVNDEVLVAEGYSSEHEPINQLRDDLVKADIFTDVRIEFVNKRVIFSGEANFFKMICRVKGGNK